MTTSTMANHLIFPTFDEIPVSTKTFIAMTNLILDLNKLFELLPITEYTVIPKKRGRKKKLGIVNQNKHVNHGSIITLKFENKLRGVDLKKKKSKPTKKSKWFRNSFTVVMILDNKPINFKICKNGMWQITGIKTDDQVDDCIKTIWEFIKYEKDNIYTFTNKLGIDDKLCAILVPAMRNIDFDLGFFVDREKLSKYMTTQTEFHSLLETSFGYTGVNIKIPQSQKIEDMTLKKLVNIDVDTSEYEETNILYREYLTLLSEKEQLKRINKDRYTTFLCFHSGRCIVSSLTAETTREAYYYFLKIIRTCWNEIEERLDK